ncbi:hypothetical protein TWF173_008356 [Orbilia oligospora]|nr:hypothetical protein TWF173_008356 [Orbilia oligospora]
MQDFGGGDCEGGNISSWLGTHLIAKLDDVCSKKRIKTAAISFDRRLPARPWQPVQRRAAVVDYYGFSSVEGTPPTRLRLGHVGLAIHN